mgnify:FL=1
METPLEPTQKKKESFPAKKHRKILPTEKQDRVEELSKLNYLKHKDINIEKLASIGAMSAGIVHEIASPLAVIKGFSEILLKKLDKEENPFDPIEFKYLLSNIHKMSKYIEEISKNIKNMSRSDDSHETIPLKSLIADATNLFSIKLNKDNVALNIDHIADGLYVSCNRIEIIQVVVNLVSNASQAIRSLPDKWIRLETRIVDQMIEINVTDSGDGIPEDIAKNIFDLFFTTKATGAGTGFGLKIGRAHV